MKRKAMSGEVQRSRFVVQIIKGIEGLITLLVRLCLTIACVVAFLTAIFGTVDVLSTYILNRPLPLARELPEVLLVLIIFLAMPQVVRDDRNVAVDLIMEHVSVPTQRIARIFALAICVGLFGFLAERSWSMALDSLAVREYAAAIYRIPIYPIKFLMCLGLVVAAIESFRLLLHTLLTGKVPAPTVTPEI